MKDTSAMKPAHHTILRTNLQRRLARPTQVHFGEGALSKRQFLKTAAGASGILLGSGFWLRALGANPGSGIPTPIPATFFFPGPVDGSAVPTDPTGAHPAGRDPSVINNFNGFVGVANVRMTGLGTDTTTGDTAPYTFEADMRFMKGVFVDSAGQTQRGAFAFI
jgi:hypothetical protein